MSSSNQDGPTRHVYTDYGRYPSYGPHWLSNVKVHKVPVPVGVRLFVVHFYCLRLAYMAHMIRTDAFVPL